MSVQRILMTADAVGGVWKYTVDLGRAFTARGIATTVAVMGPPPSEHQRREASNAGIEVVDRPYRLEWMDDPWADVAQAGAWLLDLERTRTPSLVHLNGYVHASLPWRAPAIVVAHSCVRTWWKAVKSEAAPSSVDRYTAAVRAGLVAARAVVAPTTAMARAVRDEYGAPDSVHSIPNGCGSFGDADTLLAAKEPFVLAAGRAWDEAKNITALCDVAASLAWPVHVAGDASSPDGAVTRLPGVHLLGRVSSSEMERWYRRASIYALPARYEPFGLSVLEAAAAGCALVLGDIPSLRENWTGAALFVPPDDRAALQATLDRLISRPAERLDLASRAHARALGFTIDRTRDEYLRVYESLGG